MSGNGVFTVPAHHCAFYGAVDLCGKPIVVRLGGANCGHGPECDQHMPVMFHLLDGRLFYGRYTSQGFLTFRCPPNGVTLAQMSIEAALFQCEKEKMPFPLRPTQESDAADPATYPSGTGDRTPGAESAAAGQAASADSERTACRGRGRPGDARIKIISALESLVSDGEWNATTREIAKRASVPRSTCYRILKNDQQVRKLMVEFRKQRLGRGPVRASQL